MTFVSLMASPGDPIHILGGSYPANKLAMTTARPSLPPGIPLLLRHCLALSSCSRKLYPYTRLVLVFFPYGKKWNFEISLSSPSRFRFESSRGYNHRKGFPRLIVELVSHPFGHIPGTGCLKANKVNPVLTEYLKSIFSTACL